MGGTSDTQRSNPGDCLDFVVLSEYLTQQRELPPPRHELYSSGQKRDERTLRAARCNGAVYDAWRNRRFFVTKEGTMGLGPRIMEVGDIVVVLFGSHFPVILRPHGSYHEFIGVSFVQGIMEGEAVSKHDADGGKDEVFVLR